MTTFHITPRSCGGPTCVKTETIALREPGTTAGTEWRVVVDGQITTPSFASKGAAEAYAGLLRSGYRRPEFGEQK